MTRNPLFRARQREKEVDYLRKQEIRSINRTLKKLHAKRDAFLRVRDQKHSAGDESGALHFDVLADNVAREIDAENIALHREKRLLKASERMERL